LGARTSDGWQARKKKEEEGVGGCYRKGKDPPSSWRVGGELFSSFLTPNAGERGSRGELGLERTSRGANFTIDREEVTS